MGIDVVWLDESGGVIATCAVSWEERMSRGAFLVSSHCVQYIDPYGDAVFNQHQLPQLIRELEQAIAQLHDSAFKHQAQQVVDFVRGCEGLHTYIKFIGD